MLASSELGLAEACGLVADAQCESCGRSLISRFGGVPAAECPSCGSEFDMVTDPRRPESHRAEWVRVLPEDVG